MDQPQIYGSNPWIVPQNPGWLVSTYVLVRSPEQEVCISIEKQCPIIGKLLSLSFEASF